MGVHIDMHIDTAANGWRTIGLASSHLMTLVLATLYGIEKSLIDVALLNFVDPSSGAEICVVIFTHTLSPPLWTIIPDGELARTPLSKRLMNYEARDSSATSSVPFFFS